MSQLFDWSDELLTGIAEIDAHHKALAGLLNELHESVHRRRGVGACREAVEKLRRCALSHLDVEERLMHESGHAGYSGSSSEQRALVHQLDEMLAKMDEENSNITFHGLHQLKVWLLQHIRAVDAAATPGPSPGEQEGVRVFGLLLKRA